MEITSPGPFFMGGSGPRTICKNPGKNCKDVIMHDKKDCSKRNQDI